MYGCAPNGWLSIDLDRYEIYFVCAEIRIIICTLLTNEKQEYSTMNNKTSAKAFTPPAKTKMGTRLQLERSLGVGYIHFFLFCPTNFFLNQLLLGYLPRHFKTLLAHLM